MTITAGAPGRAQDGRGVANVGGLDLSLTRTGVCLPSGHTTSVVTPRGVAGEGRFSYIAVACATLFGSGTDLVVMEDWPTTLKGNAAKGLGMLHGAVRREFHRHSVPYVVIPPSTLKLFATGNGSSDKVAMMRAARLQAGREFPNDDECDAWWCRMAGLVHHRAESAIEFHPEQVRALYQRRKDRKPPMSWDAVLVPVM